MVIQHPCSKCNKGVKENQKAILCDVCGYWSHTKCNFVRDETYYKLMESDENWCCQSCINNNQIFSKITDGNMKLVLQGINSINYDPESLGMNANYFKEINSTLPLLNEYNNETDLKDKNYQNFIPSDLCKYHTLSDLNQINNDELNLSFLHLNMNSLKLHYTEFQKLLNDSDIKFTFVGITETGLKISKTLDLEGYEQVECPTESSKGGVKLYFSNEIKNYTERNDLKIYKTSQLESKFIEV